MKGITVICLAVVLAVSFALSAFAAETMRGTIRGIDKAKGTITFCPEGTNERMPLDVSKAVDLKNIETDTKVEINVETREGKKSVSDIKVLQKKRKAIEGC
jgi:Cu/Ag efflux protein CusF